MKIVGSLIAAGSLLAVVACGAASEDVTAGESEVISAPADAGGTTEAAAADADAGPEASAPAELAPYTEYSVEPKLRWSIDGAPVTEGFNAELAEIASLPHRYRLQALTPTPGGKPAVYLEFGRGEDIAVGDYDCAKNEAVVVVVEADGTKKMTAIAQAPSRPCNVHIDAAEPFPELPGMPAPKNPHMKRVLGRFDAVVGLREDAEAPTRTLRGAFAMIVDDTPPL